MKKALFALAFLMVAFLSNTAVAQTIEIIDFHSEHRCRTCLAIEDLTKSVLNKHFSRELKNGKIVFRSINVDDKANEALVQQFLAFGTALWVYRADRKVKVDLTDFAFMNYANTDKFTARLKSEIQKAL
jgi:hypothetical protein